MRKNYTSFRFDDKELANEFYETVANRFGRQKGAVGNALNEAVRVWVQKYGTPKAKVPAK